MNRKSPSVNLETLIEKDYCLDLKGCGYLTFLTEIFGLG